MLEISQVLYPLQSRPTTPLVAALRRGHLTRLAGPTGLTASCFWTSSLGAAPHVSLFATECVGSMLGLIR